MVVTVEKRVEETTSIAGFEAGALETDVLKMTQSWNM